MVWPLAPVDGSAVPKEFVPGVAALVPSVPPIDICDPMRLRPNAAVAKRAIQRAKQRRESGIMIHAPHIEVTWIQI